MTKTKFTLDQKTQIVLKSIRANLGMAELYRMHNLGPQTFHT